MRLALIWATKPKIWTDREVKIAGTLLMRVSTDLKNTPGIGHTNKFRSYWPDLS